MLSTRLVSTTAALLFVSASPSSLADIYVDAANASCATGTGTMTPGCQRGLNNSQGVKVTFAP